MVGSSNEISRETCQVQNVDEQIVKICSAERCSIVPWPVVRAAITIGSKIAALGQVRMKRLAGVRALVVATKRCNITPWSKGGQEGRCERTNVT